MFAAIAVLLFGAVTLLSVVYLPLLDGRLMLWHQNKARVVGRQLDEMFYEKNPKTIMLLYYILPVAFGFAAFILYQSPALAIAGMALGLSIPTFILKLYDLKRRMKFEQQILDAIMLMSSSLKGGLSLLQALEVVVEEMASPMSQEMGLVVRETKMGLTLEESLLRLNKRMKMEELRLVVNSLLVARETGGDLTKVLARLVTTIRDNRKLQENIKTLTMQGRLQGIVMSCLPFVFVWWVFTFNKHHFDIMLTHEIGRMALVIAIVLQIVGLILIRRFCEIKV